MPERHINSLFPDSLSEEDTQFQLDIMTLF